MPEYENGKQTRQHILDAARSLFWSKGYNQTRFEDFRSQYGINTGLVHYHFKKKELLAKEIYSSIIDETNELISSVVDKEQPLLHFVMLFHIMWKYFGDSPAYARFVKEVIHIRIHSEAVFIPCLASCYSLNDHYRLGLTELDCKIRDLALIGSQVELINAFLSGTLPLSTEECSYQDVTNALHLLNIPDKEILASVNQSGTLLAEHCFVMKDNFQQAII